MPEEFFGQKQPYLIAHVQKHAILVQRANRDAALVCATKVENEAPRLAEDAADFHAEAT